MRKEKNKKTSAITYGRFPYFHRSEGEKKERRLGHKPMIEMATNRRLPIHVEWGTSRGDGKGMGFSAGYGLRRRKVKWSCFPNRFRL